MSANLKSSLLAFLSHPQLGLVEKATSQALRFSLGKRLSNEELADSIPNASELLLNGDPLFGGGAGVDMNLILEFAPQVERVSLAAQKVVNASCIGQFKALKALNLNGAKLEELDFLTVVGPLEELMLAKPQNPNADFLKSLPLGKLRKANFSGWEAQDLAFLADCNHLEVLLLNENNISTGALLAKLASLKELRIDRNLLDDIEFCRKLRALKVLSFADNRVGDLEPLESCYELADLSFAKNAVRSLKPLRSLRNLCRVSCFSNPLTDDDFDSIPRSVRID